MDGHPHDARKAEQRAADDDKGSIGSQICETIGREQAVQDRGESAEQHGKEDSGADKRVRDILRRILRFLGKRRNDLEAAERDHHVRKRLQERLDRTVRGERLIVSRVDHRRAHHDEQRARGDEDDAERRLNQRR